MKNKITIIVPAYNSEENISECLASLRNQTLENIKIICVNDGSTDNTLSIMKEHAEEDERISIIDQKNGGRSAARSIALSQVKTEYVMFCDSDDKFKKDMCEKMLVAIEGNDVDIAACGIEVLYHSHDEMEESDSNYYRIEFAGKQPINEEVIKRTDASICNKILKMDIIKKYEINFPKGLNNEDYYFFNAYMSVSKNIFFIQQKLYQYIRHDNGSIMSDSFDANNYLPDHLLVAKKLFVFYKKYGFLREHTDLFWHQFVESYWFSYNHSAKKSHTKIRKIAKKFIDQNYKTNLPTKKSIRREVDLIRKKYSFTKILGRLRAIIARIYKSISGTYRRQYVINKELEKMVQENYDLLDTTNNILSK